MAKMFKYMIILSGLMLILTLLGVPTSLDNVLSITGVTPSDSATWQDTGFFSDWSGWLALMAGVTVVLIGLASRTISDLPLSATAAAILFFMINDMKNIVLWASNEAVWAGWLVFILMAPLMAGFVLSVWDWARGRD